MDAKVNKRGGYGFIQFGGHDEAVRCIVDMSGSRASGRVRSRLPAGLWRDGRRHVQGSSTRNVSGLCCWLAIAFCFPSFCACGCAHRCCTRSNAKLFLPLPPLPQVLKCSWGKSSSAAGAGGMGGGAGPSQAAAAAAAAAALPLVMQLPGGAILTPGMQGMMSLQGPGGSPLMMQAQQMGGVQLAGVAGGMPTGMMLMNAAGLTSGPGPNPGGVAGGPTAAGLRLVQPKPMDPYYAAAAAAAAAAGGAGGMPGIYYPQQQ